MNMRILNFIILTAFFLTTSLYASENKEDITKGKDTTRKWLQLMDEGKYDQSWYNTSSRFQAMFPLADWVKTMKEQRSPMGRALRRTMLEQRVANNPKDLPPGFYMVLYYHTKFAGKDRLVGELITLIENEDGNWFVLSYQLS